MKVRSANGLRVIFKFSEILGITSSAQRTEIFQLFSKIMALFTLRTNKQGSLLTSEHYFHDITSKMYMSRTSIYLRIEANVTELI